ncbi:MAG: ABC transporter permease [Planctomycetota bacterium]
MPWRAFLGLAYVLACAALLIGPLLTFLIGTARGGAFADYTAPNAAEQERLTGLFWVNIRIALGATTLAVLCGVTVALSIHRARGAWRKILAAVYPLPLLLPPTVVTIAWTHLIGKRGLAAMLWRDWTGAEQLPFSMYGEAGSAWVLGLCFFPLVTMSTLVGLRAIGPTSTLAARVHASPWRRWWSIDTPLLLPYVSAGAICVAWLSVGDFEVPPVLLLNTYTLQIYAAIKSFELAKALLLCLPLLGATALFLGLRQLLVRGSAEATLDDHWRAQTAPPDPVRGGRLLPVAALAVLLLAVLAPVASLAHQSTGWPKLRLGLQTAGGQVWNSFETALGAAALALVVGAPYAWLLATRRGWIRAALALLACVPLAIPGTIHGLAWSEALQLTHWGRELLTAPVVVSLAAAARFFPLSVFLLAAAFAGLHPGLDAAARVAGAGFVRRGWTIHLPLLYPGLLAAFAIVYALAVGELACSILINPVGFMTLPVRLSSLLHFGQDELLAALCLVQIFMSWIPYLAAAALLERVLEVKLG